MEEKDARAESAGGKIVSELNGQDVDVVSDQNAIFSGSVVK